VANKKIYTRDEFENLLESSAKEMASDKQLCDDALDLFVHADRHRWVHQTKWFGEPILNLPQDMFALQEIIFKTKPKFIIEIGVAWGGSLLFHSTLLEVLGGQAIIGVDTFIPDDLKARLASHGSLSERLILIEGSSVEQNTVDQIQSIIGDCREVMIILDSFHTHEHVLNELRMYSPLVGKGYYLICSDTIVEDIPEQKHRTRPWGPGNNPKTALKQFLSENDRFQIDTIICNKLLLTCNPDGYLKCCKDL
jgi:cephalosporin hydroxylase